MTGHPFEDETGHRSASSALGALGCLTTVLLVVAFWFGVAWVVAR